MKHLLTVAVLLLALTCCTTEADRIRMRAGLDSINMRNRNDLPFTVSDVQPYVDFFDEHGTSNDRLLAHYLLGRAYHEHGEAPMALQCYQDAVECADTLNADCDYPQLARVYGQMAQVFYEQGLYRQQLSHEQQSVRFAWKGKDTLLALRNYEQEFYGYKGLSIMDSAKMVIDSVSKKYSQYNFPSYSAIALGSSIRTLINEGNHKKAREYMNRYETESGRFDKQGFIIKGHEAYYNIKGLLYLKEQNLDSAEYWYRKEFSNGKDLNNQNGGALGLAMVYYQRHQSDSAVKYYRFAYDMNDSVYAKMATKEVERIQAMYDYTRHKEIAQQEKERAAQTNRKLLVSLVVLLAVLLLSSWLYIARKKLIETLQETAMELDAIKGENSELKRDVSANQQQITENEKRISLLEQKLGRYSKLVYFGIEKTENNLKNSPNYQQIKEKAYRGQKLSSEDWEAIRNLTNEYLPAFYDYIISQTKIDSTEYRICLLLRLHFKAGEIAHMLGVTPPYISKASTEILSNLCSQKGSSKELYKELCKIS